MKRNEYIRLILPDEFALECLRDEWNLEIHQQESAVLTFWDTFEWGLWFSGHLLYSCGGVYRLCTLEEGWLGAVLCEERAEGRLRFCGDFKTAEMRSKLDIMLGLRGLAPVVEGTFRLCQCDLRNDIGKIVCRLDWTSVSTAERGGGKTLNFCHVIPLLGYEDDAARVLEYLAINGAETPISGSLDVLLRQVNREPKEYTLRPAFGLEMQTSAREAVGRIVRMILAIANDNVPGILNDIDTEFLHDYRICLRKVRSMLSLVKDVYPAEETRVMRNILGKLAQQTNRLRDLDVYLLARDEYLGLLPPEMRPALKVMFDDFSAEREVEVRRVISKMRAPSTRKMFRELEEYFSTEAAHEHSLAADHPIGALVFRRIYKCYRKINELGTGINVETPDETVHQLRIECKKLRYLMEFFSDLIPSEERSAIQKLLRRLQNQLGEFNDASVQQKSLLNYWEQKKSGTEVALGLGGLVSILYYRQQQTRSLIEQALKEFCDGSLAAAFKKTFKLPAAVPAAAADARRSAK